MKTAIDTLREKFKNNFLDSEYIDLIVEAMEEYALSQLEQKDKELEEVKAEVMRLETIIDARAKERMKTQTELTQLKASLEGEERDAIGFAEWIRKETFLIEKGTWIQLWKNEIRFTTEQLYTKYLSSKANQGEAKQ